jgi:cysteine desulfuration protein SufE
LLSECFRRKLPIVTTGGAGGRRDPRQIKIADLAFTHGDRFLAQVRKLLRQRYGSPRDEVPFHIPCVFSSEPAYYPTPDGNVTQDPVARSKGRLGCAMGLGTATFITGTFGFYAAAIALEQLLQQLPNLPNLPDRSHNSSPSQASSLQPLPLQQAAQPLAIAATPHLSPAAQQLHQRPNTKQKFAYLLKLAQTLPTFPESERTLENRVPGCQANVYLTAELVQDQLQFRGDSDSQIIKGLLAYLIDYLNGLTPTAISQLKPDFVQASGLDLSLTPSRVNGFYNLFQAMQQRAKSLADQS